MKCASALSTITDSRRAIDQAKDALRGGLAGATADLVVAFISPGHADKLESIADELLASNTAKHVIGCTGEAIVGSGREVEGAPAISLWAVCLPAGGVVRPFRLAFDGLDLTEGPEIPDGNAALLLADPFTVPIDAWLSGVNERKPSVPIFGGNASGGHRPGSNRLAIDGSVFDDGAVGVALDGTVSLRAVVSQGCRPIGRHFVVTKSEKNIIRELAGRPALDVFQELYASLDEDDQELIQRGIHIGRVINEYQERFRRGDFLVRNVLGADDSGGIGITESVRVGQTVQFHVRDAATADEDLRVLLAEAHRSGTRPAGALVFTCNGRGSRLFDEPNHDATALLETFGPVPAAGFFAMGEFGPIGGKTFVHGFTASIALVEETSI